MNTDRRFHDASPRPAAEDELQAQALCDLLTDPRSRITRVRLVGAPAGLRSAVEHAAAARGGPTRGAGGPTGPTGPTGRAGGAGGAGRPAQSARKR